MQSGRKPVPVVGHKTRAGPAIYTRTDDDRERKSKCGLTVRIEATDTQAHAIEFYVSGRLNESAPVHTTVELAKVIATAAIDQRIPQDAEWQAAEERERRARFMWY